MRFKQVGPRYVVLEPEAMAAGLSLEALGLLAHIVDDQSTEVLQAAFPDYDVDALVAELLAAGVVSVEQNSPLPQVGPLTTVYVIEAAGAFKIGVTGNLKRRLKHFRTHAPSPPRVVWHRKFADAGAVEIEIHAFLAPFRTHGEWFACTIADIQRALAGYGDSEG